MKAWTNLVRTVAPALEPVTLAEAKAQLRIDDLDSDAEISAWISAAVSMIDGPRGIGIAMINQTWRQSLDLFPANGIEIRLGPVSAISSITYVDIANVTQTLASDVYAVDLDTTPTMIRLAHNKAWPATYDQPGAVKVTFVAGFGASAATVPGTIKAAIKLLVAHFYTNREALGDNRLVELPLGVNALLSPYRTQLI